MRINKYIASAGICSRRKADELIEQGRVKVNGAVLREPGFDVSEGDLVLVDGKPVTGSERFVYYALNKPAGYVTTTSDEMDRPTVMELMTEVSARVFPVGRLDYETTGLLIMTNDGDLANHITHPSKKVFKTYLAEIDGEISLGQAEQLRRGVDIGGYTTRPAQVEILKQAGHSKVRISISEGKNRQVRRMFKAVGFNVVSLQRISIGRILLGHLHEGHYRRLTAEEVDYLKNC
ncbi:MAG: rRNA pseudouridine synthase [Firmicutes bacterium]|nr:rRNA pseudouridine synthase [Bacillota bacterium]MBQ2454536.1 rRNA pseudouridine synthase [Bacillota bacterium]MBQ4234484.1 rRNA pseudouridine synthase [Bacillota bacterium]